MFGPNSGLYRKAIGDSHILPGALALSRVIGFVSCPWHCPVSAAAARLCPALCFPPPGPFGPGYMPCPPARPGLGADIQACVGGWFRRGSGEMNPVLGRRTARTRRISATGPVCVAAQRASPDFPAPAAAVPTCPRHASEAAVPTHSSVLPPPLQGGNGVMIGTHHLGLKPRAVLPDHFAARL